MKCMYCGRLPQQAPAGVYYLDMFYKNKCDCGYEDYSCGNCLTKPYQKKDNIFMTNKCRVCNLDERIKTVLK